MKLEHRYYVIKKSECSPSERVLAESVGKGTRIRAKKPPLECLVIEKDWPEYLPTLALLAARVDAKAPLLEGDWEAPKAPENPWRDHDKEDHPTGQVNAEAFSHYYRDVRHISGLDVYRILSLFEVTDPAIQHAVKKLLCAGLRGAKNREKDYNEAIASVKRAIEMMNEDTLTIGV